LETRSGPRSLQYRTMTNASWLDELLEEAEAAEEAAAAAAQGADEQIEVVLYPAGKIAYAQILTEANSDVPGPVLAQIASGPLSGSRVLGSFSKETELLTIKFDTVIVDGVSIDINGSAIDPKTTLPAMATDVDHHYLARI